MHRCSYTTVQHPPGHAMLLSIVIWMFAISHSSAGTDAPASKILFSNVKAKLARKELMCEIFETDVEIFDLI